jgi:hypothetical protein
MKYRVKGFKDLNTKVPQDTVFNTILVPSNFNTDEMGVETNLSSTTIDYKRQGFREEHTLVTLDELRVTDIVEAVSNVEATHKIEFTFDRKNLNNYAYYGPLKDTFDTAISNIIKEFPAGLHVNHHYITEDGYTYELTVLDFLYDSKTNTSSMKIPVYLVENPLLLYYGQPNMEQKGIKNIVTDYTSYALSYNGTDFPVISFTGVSSSNSNYIYLTVNGNPFQEETSGGAVSLSVAFHVKPVVGEYQGFMAKLSPLERYLLGDMAGAPYKTVFTIPVDNGVDDVYYDDYEFEWPSTDGYNIDIDTSEFVKYVATIGNVCELYDEFKTNKLLRMMVPYSLVDLDQTNGQKMEKLIKGYGKVFDEAKLFIDGLTTVNNLDYDPTIGTPKALVKELAESLGWNVFPIVNGSDLLDKSGSQVYNDGSRSYLPSEVDVEVWNRIINNTSFFMKTKGTRHAVEAILAIIGVPKEIIEFNEYIYIAESPVLNEDGEWIYPQAHEDMHFQMYGEKNRRNYYIERYIEQGFKLKRVVDNKKTWSENSTVDRRLVINSKELALTLSVGRLLENDILSFMEEEQDVVMNDCINVGSLKTESDSATNSYSDLHAQLLAYQQGEPNPITFQQVLKYAKTVDSYWRNFVSQMLPATAIITEDGVSIKNTAFTPQRFTYQEGISSGSEFVTNNPVQVTPV